MNDPKRKTFDLGLWPNPWKKSKNRIRVKVEMRLDYDDRGMRLSFCGDVTDRNSNVTCGQCDGYLAEIPGFKEKYGRLLEVWKRWHLNDMRAGTLEQEKAIEDWKAAGNKYDYDAACEMLKKAGLYEVDLDGRKYKYGHAWLFEKIPDDVALWIYGCIEKGDLT